MPPPVPQSSHISCASPYSTLLYALSQFFGTSCKPIISWTSSKPPPSSGPPLGKYRAYKFPRATHRVRTLTGKEIELDIEPDYKVPLSSTFFAPYPRHRTFSVQARRRYTSSRYPQYFSLHMRLYEGKANLHVLLSKKKKDRWGGFSTRPTKAKTEPYRVEQTKQDSKYV